MKYITESVKKENRLWLKNGKVVKNLAELRREILNLDERAFRKHVNGKKNDFYGWVKYNYGDKKLAEELFECSSKESIILCIESRMKNAEKRKRQNERNLAREAAKAIQGGSLPMTSGEDAKINIFKYNRKNTRIEPVSRNELIAGIIKCQG